MKLFDANNTANPATLWWQNHNKSSSQSGLNWMHFNLALAFFGPSSAFVLSSPSSFLSFSFRSAFLGDLSARSTWNMDHWRTGADSWTDSSVWRLIHMGENEMLQDLSSGLFWATSQGFFFWLLKGASRLEIHTSLPWHGFNPVGMGYIYREQ